MTVHVFGETNSPCCANLTLKRIPLDQKKVLAETSLMQFCTNCKSMII